MKYLIVAFCGVFFCNISVAQIPSVEMRGVWVATISNLDWPSSSNLSEKEQKKEIISILNFYEGLHFNCIFLQVRPSADVLYPSKYEPWSKYLSGKQGVKPKYNPLKFWIKEAHKRNIELHAWINPYRVANSDKEKLSKHHPAIINSKWIVNYGGKKYYNPALKPCKELVKNIVSEIVRKYDIDGIHFDDYFYPYPVKNENFPDSVNFVPYSTKFKSIEDWRRENVNKTIQELQQTIKEIKPYVQFGVSPFGVWRNRKDDELGSETNAGVTNYDNLYADVYKWMQSGWVDYVIPQLYWSRNNSAVPFEHLTNWWSANSNGTNVYIGHAAYKLGNGKKDWDGADEIIQQVKINRSDSLTYGSVFFRHQFLKQNKYGLADSLKNDLYPFPALVPSVYSRNSSVPGKVSGFRQKNQQLVWKYKKQKKANVKNFALYVILKGGEKQLVQICSQKKINVSEIDLAEKKLMGFQVTAVNKFNNESEGSNIIWL